MGNNTSSSNNTSKQQSSSSSSGHEIQQQQKQAKSQQPHKHPTNKSTITSTTTTTTTPTTPTITSFNTNTPTTSITKIKENVTNPSNSLGTDRPKTPLPPKTTTPPPSPPPPPEKQPPQEDTPSRPVPISSTCPNIVESTSTRSQSHRSSLENSSIPLIQDMSYHLTRPPRLPLPIEEEVHTPGSPIIPPADADAPPLDLFPQGNAELRRQGSQSSRDSVDEEDEEPELSLDNTKAVVPTLVEWVGGTENTKVYVTGSIFSWNKKQRLHPDPNRPGVFSANVHVRPGTHHLNFLIDGVMTTSSHLPTTVDFNNHLVNYIEVSSDDIPRPQPPPTPPKSASASSSPPNAKPPPTPKMKPTIPLTSYTAEIPGYLDDLDLPEDCEPYQRAAAAIEKFPPPPSLPGFLAKPILNAATPMKDDNSVLILPNHTVLNHLATSSIKNGVLAVSATTRYKKKYVTTIMYKPT